MVAVERYHALGNDYLVWCGDAPLTPALARAICDRHTGAGSDGVLVRGPRRGAAEVCQIWNPDGSIAEKSGNGLRIFARWLVDAGHAAPDVPIPLWTGTDAVVATVRSGSPSVVADMGTASFEPADVPARAELLPRLEGVGGPWDVVVVGLGNPHCVVFVDDVEAAPWRAWGEVLEVHPAFPRRTNVQVVAVIGPASLSVRIWERGAGPTQASGSSACAAASAAVRAGRLAAGPITVVMPGGEVKVEVSPDFALRLDGPVERVGRLELDPGWWASRMGLHTCR